MSAAYEGLGCALDLTGFTEAVATACEFGKLECIHGHVSQWHDRVCLRVTEAITATVSSGEARHDSRDGTPVCALVGAPGDALLTAFYSAKRMAAETWVKPLSQALMDAAEHAYLRLACVGDVTLSAKCGLDWGQFVVPPQAD